MRDGPVLAGPSPHHQGESSVSKPKVAFIGTGGTISSLGVHPLELQDYIIHNNRMHAGQIVDRFPTVREIAEVIPVDFRNVPSTDIYFAEWHELAMLCGKLAAEHPDRVAAVAIRRLSTGEAVLAGGRTKAEQHGADAPWVSASDGSTIADRLAQIALL